MMDQLQIATARHHTYLLLSRLYLQGMTADLQPFVDEIPQLATVCSRPFNSDRSAADHHHIFSYDIYPYESVFRDPSGLLGGQNTTQLEEVYRASGYMSGNEPGHIGQELAYLAALCERQARAMPVNQLSVSNRYAKLQAGMLHNHLLHWLPVLEIALSFSIHPFYSALGDVTLSLVSDHAATLDPGNEFDNQDRNRFAPPDIGNDPQTNLKKIAHFLATPPHSGIYLGREAIAGLARTVQLPRGFGGRRQMMANLLRSASQYGSIPALFTELASYANKWRESYSRQIEVYPRLASWIRPWQQLASTTAVSLAQMQQLAQAAT